MKTELVSVTTVKLLNELVQKSFDLNRIADRDVSLIETRFNMPILGGLFHQKVAHAFSGIKFGDGIGDFMKQRGVEVLYEVGVKGTQSYENPAELFVSFYQFLTEYEDFCSQIVAKTSAEGDYATESKVKEVINNLVPYLDLVSTLSTIFSGVEAPYQWHLIDANIEPYFRGV